MITSIENKQLKNIKALLDRSSARKKQGLFVAEGVRMFEETPDELIDRIYVSESFVAKNQAIFDAKVKDHLYEVVEDGIFKKLSDTNTPQGVLVTVRMPKYEEDRLLFSSLTENSSKDCPADKDVKDHPTEAGRKITGDYLVLNKIQDPGNLGTMIRTAEAAGIRAVIMDEGCADIFNPKVIRSTMGSIYRVPFLITKDLLGLMTKMKGQGVSFIAGELNGSDFFEAKRPNGPVGILIGNEGNGLDKEVIEASDIRLRIPMEGEVSSLNAAVSAALFMFFMKYLFE